MKCFNFNSIILALVVTLILSSCSKELEVPQSQLENALQFSISSKSYSGNAPGILAQTADDYKTSFVNGDKIGLFGVKNGVVLTDINNVRITYDAAGNKWNFDGGKVILYNKEKEGVIFYAYYPYNENSASQFDVTQPDPFVNMVNNWEIGFDLRDEKYAGNDLMSGSAIATANGADYSINLNLKHRLALLSISLPSLIYTFTNTSPVLNPYTVEAKNVSFRMTKSGGTETTISPYFDAKSGTYRILINPNTAYVLKGDFTDQAEADRGYSIDLGTGIGEGKFATYTIDGGVQRKNHELKVGDLFCEDGSIIVKETSSIPANCIGVVYYVGNAAPSVAYAQEAVSYLSAQDALQRDHPGCTHGLVMGIKERENKFSDITGEMRVWYRKEFQNNSSYIDLGGISWNGSATGAAADIAPERDRLLGYNNTQLIKLFAQNKSGSFFALQELAQYRPISPSISSGWYLPSFGDFKIINSNLTVVNEQLSKVTGATALTIDGNYWTSTERNSSNMHYAIIRSSGTVSVNSGGRKNHDDNVYKYRFSLAF